MVYNNTEQQPIVPKKTKKDFADKNTERVWVVEKKRWVMLSVFSLVNMVNAMLWICFSPVQNTIRLHYACSSLYVDLLSICFMAVSFPVCPLSAYITDKLGLRISVMIAAVLNMGGAWIRYGGADPSLFWVLFAGQTMAALGQPFVLNAPAKIATVWFKSSERTIATTLGSLSNVLGVGVGFAIGPLLVNQATDIPLFLLVQAAIASATSLLAIVVFRDKPTHYPSLAAELSSEEQASFKQDLKNIFTNIPFLIHALAFGNGLGLFNALTTLLGQIVSPYGYGQGPSGLFGGSLLVAGILLSGVGALIVDFTKSYKSVLVVSAVGVAGSLAWFTLALYPNNFIMLMFACGAIGVFGMTILPIALEMAVELVFPSPEALVSGVLMQVGQLFGIIHIVVLNALQAPPPGSSMIIPCWIMVGIGCSVAVLFLINPVKYRRLIAEKQQKEASTANNNNNIESQTTTTTTKQQQQQQSIQ